MTIIHYLEIVCRDVAAQCAVLERVHGLSFGPVVPELGQARVAEVSDGSRIGVRAPLAEHEQPIMRTYLEVEDIAKAVQEVEAAGAVIAYPPTRQGDSGTWAIYFLGDVQLGLWQRPPASGPRCPVCGASLSDSRSRLELARDALRHWFHGHVLGHPTHDCLLRALYPRNRGGLGVRARGLTPSLPFVGNGMWVTSLRDPDGYSVEFESQTDVPEDTTFDDKASDATA
jgi:catechol 2,3-dioxygenase-like lactoylglutathione lyase family enzyme